MNNPNRTKQEKAKGLRYKKPLVKNICLDSIREFLWEVSEKCGDVFWFCEDEETLLNALEGDEDDLHEFKLLFVDLSAECERMQNDLENEWVPECFDTFFAATYSYGMGAMLGYDAFEQDYYGLSDHEYTWASEEAKKQILRMTKEQLIETSRQCIKIFIAYCGLRDRYQSLEAALDILKEQNGIRLDVARRINELHERLENWNDRDAEKEFDLILDTIPQEEWLK